jgi:hypothetical protein
VSDQNERDLLNYYFQNDFTPDELSDKDNVAVKKAIEQSKKFFLKDKDSMASRERQQEQLLKNQRAALDNSLEKSVAEFKKNNPKVPDTVINRMREDLKKKPLTDPFLRNGAFTSTAVENWYILNNKATYRTTIEQDAMKKAQKQLEVLVGSGSPDAIRTFGSRQFQPPTKENNPAIQAVTEILGVGKEVTGRMKITPAGTK